MKRVCLLTALSLAAALRDRRAVRTRAAQTSPGAGPVVVLDTVKGMIEIETYPEDAPKTVAAILDLVKKGFYNGLRFHRAEANFLVQIGDPKSRDMSLQEWWGRYGSGKPIGVAEITKKRRQHQGRRRAWPTPARRRTPTASSTSRCARRRSSTRSSPSSAR